MTTTDLSQNSRGNDTEHWDTFTRFARKFFESEQYHVQERGYKLKIGERLVETRDAFRQGDKDWIERLKRAFGPPNNLTQWQDHDTVIKWSRHNPSSAAAAFELIWDPQRSVQDRIDDFIAAVSAPKKISLAVASFIHMAMDPLSYPIFRPTPVDNGMRLTGYPTMPPSGPTSSGGRYDHYLGFLDRVLEETSLRGVELRDRLDAQSVLWMITKYPPEYSDLFPGWSMEERQAFAAFRGTPLPSEASTRPPVSSDHASPPPRPANEPLPLSAGEYETPEFDVIRTRIAGYGMRLPEQTLRRYHLSLATRGFVILAGVSGTGKTWLAEAYAESVGARHLIVAVAPNWTSNEDLLGFFNPISNTYHDTAFTRFLREAEAAYSSATEAGHMARPFHLILDEMNLARVEYYFAGFLSAMEVRNRHGEAKLDLGPHNSVTLPPNLFVVGTVNIDETTHGFADKVYDRAQLVELKLQRDDVRAHLAGRTYRDVLLTIWDAVAQTGPFAFRVLDDVASYMDAAEMLGVPWEVSLDEQLVQKILPKLSGARPGMEMALERIVDVADQRFPLTHERAQSMLEGFRANGFASYFA